MGTNGINNSVYNSFYTVNTNGNSHIASKNNKKSKIESIYNKPVASLYLSDVNKQEKKGLKGWVIGIGSTALALAVASVFLTRGASGKFVSKLNNWISKLDDEIYQNASQNKAAGFIQKIMLGVANGAKTCLHGAKMASNFTPFKDTIADKIFTNKFSKAIGLHKIPEWCTKFSRNLTMKTNTKWARNVQGCADDLVDYVKGVQKGFTPAQLAENITIEGTTLTRAQWIQKAQNYADEIHSKTVNTFSTSARNARFAQMEEKLTGLDSEVTKALFSKDAKKTILNGYVTENMTAKGRKELTNALQAEVRQISNNIDNVSGQIGDSLNIIRGSLNNRDRSSMDYARKLAKKLTEFKQLSGAQEATQRAELSKEMESLIDSLKSSINKNANYSAGAKENLLSQCDLINSIMNSHEKGAAEHLHTILKSISNKEDAQRHIAQISNFSKMLNKAAKFEEGVYLRQAELKLGAAFTDIGFLALTAGSGVLATCKEDTMEGKISKGLTLGIPLIGTTGLCLWQTSLGMTGILPLALSFLGGAILNKAGSAISNQYIASNNKKQQLLAELNAFKNTGKTVINPFSA